MLDDSALTPSESEDEKSVDFRRRVKKTEIDVFVLTGLSIWRSPISQQTPTPQR